MKKVYLLAMIMMIMAIFIVGCSVPKVGLLKGTPNPLKEYTLEGTGADKIAHCGKRRDFRQTEKRINY